MLSKEAVSGMARQRHAKVHKPGLDAVTAIYSDCEECQAYIEKEERAGDFWRQIYLCSINNQLPAEKADEGVKEAKIRGYL